MGDIEINCVYIFQWPFWICIEHLELYNCYENDKITSML